MENSSILGPKTTTNYSVLATKLLAMSDSQKSKNTSGDQLCM